MNLVSVTPEAIEIFPINLLLQKYSENLHSLKKTAKNSLLGRRLKIFAKSNNKKNTRVNFKIFSLSFKVTISLIKIVVLNFENFLMKSDNIDSSNI